MMQMLEAGGMSIMTDGERGADIDNPKGYYEWEDIKKIGEKPELLGRRGGGPQSDQMPFDAPRKNARPATTTKSSS